MIFQTLDNKIECRGVFLDNKVYSEPPKGLTATWSYSPNLPLDVEYANLYCHGKTISEVCPEGLRSEWENASFRLKAYLNSFIHAKINLNEHCFYDLVPQNFLYEYYSIKTAITEHVLQTYKKPDNYEFLLGLTRTIKDIGQQKLKIKRQNLKGRMSESKTRNFLKKIGTSEPYIKYNIRGTKTGRLTTVKDSFPILTLSKEHRACLEPNNDLFVEFDFNAAELRVLLALSGLEQPTEDIHEWNAKNVFRGLQNRKESKERIFAWLYNPESKDYLANRAYDRDSVLQKYWDGKNVCTIYDRKIQADRHHALNYIIQSTTADLFLRQMVKIHKFLEDKRSSVAFSIHDSLVLDFAQSEKDLIGEISNIFANTDLGKFKVNLSLGKNFGRMKRVCM